MPARSNPAPWFGAWPPTLKMGGYMGKAFVAQLRKQSTTRLLSFIGALGISLMIAAQSQRIQSEKDIASLMVEIGLAFLVASILGLIVDRELKQGLVADAVEVSLGYLLPDELKDELRWIYGLSVMGQQTFHVLLEHDPAKRMVIFHGTVIRVLENKSEYTERRRITGGCDEWFMPGRETSVEQCEYKIIKRGETGPIQSVKPRITRYRHGLSYGEDVELPAGARLELTFVYSIPFPDHAFEVLTYRFPVNQPLVTVSVPDTLSASISVYHRKQYERGDHEHWQSGHLMYRMDGVLLPQQGIQVVWHRKDEFEKRVTDV